MLRAINHSNTFLFVCFNKGEKKTQLIDALIIDVNQEPVFIDAYFIQRYFSHCIECIFAIALFSQRKKKTYYKYNVKSKVIDIW